MENQQKTIVIGLGVVVVLLVGIIGVMMYQQSVAVPEPSVNGAAQSAPAPAGGEQPAAQPAPVDPASAVKLPEGTTPEQWVDEYYAACDKGDYETAVSRLPADKQAGTTPEALGEQLAGYGITGYSITSATEEGDAAVVVVDQTTDSFGTFENTWQFQKDGDGWIVVSKAVTGMK